MVWGELESFRERSEESAMVYGMAWRHDGNYYSFLFYNYKEDSNKLVFSQDWIIDGMGWSPHLNMDFDFLIDMGDNMNDDEE